MLKNGTNIIASTSFRNNIKTFLEEIDKEQGPVFLTVNGEGTHVIMHVDTYDELLRNREFNSNLNTMNPHIALIESSKTLFEKEIYEILSSSYKEEWSTLTEEELETIRTSIEMQSESGMHQTECFHAKVRAYNALVPEDKKWGAKTEIKN